MIHNNQSGRTMMEMLGVLAIMGIITYGAISGINYGMTSYKVNKLYIEIPDIINGMQDMYFNVFGRNAYGDTFRCDTINYPGSASCKTLIKNGILPATKVGGSATRDLVIKIEHNQLSIQFQGKNDVCKRLKDMDWNVQSIDCYVDSGLSQKCLGNECGHDNQLFFLPK